jgi:hypothetical protein
MDLDKTLRKIEKCAKSKGFTVDSKLIMKLVERTYDCKKEKELISCQDCSELPNCKKVEELLELSHSVCYGCRTRENCGRIEGFLIWLNCLS